MKRFTTLFIAFGTIILSSPLYAQSGFQRPIPGKFTNTEDVSAEIPIFGTGNTSQGLETLARKGPGGSFPRSGKVDYNALNAAFLKVSPSIAPQVDDAIIQLVLALRYEGFEVTPFFEPKANGKAIDKICAGSRVYDALIYFTSNRKWNPFLVPRTDVTPQDSLENDDFDKSSSNSTSIKSTGNKNEDFKNIAQTINPSDGDAIVQLADKMKAAGYNCTPYGEPKLGGTPIDKIVIDGKVYDALVYFEGAKRWNPGLVYIEK